jgi:hypothetical protein
MIVKEHITPDRRLILAVCDASLHGKVFEEGDKVLDLKSSFYKGKKMDKPKVRELMKKAYMVHCIGKETVALAQELSMVAPENIIKVRGIPCCQVLLLPDG